MRRRYASCYSSVKVANTTPHFTDSRLMDADIELNAVDYVFVAGRYAAVQRASSDPRPEVDLESVLVHEIGHVLGFEHPDGDVNDSIMHPTPLEPGAQRRSLAPPNVAAVCTSYPRSP